MSFTHWDDVKNEYVGFRCVRLAPITALDLPLVCSVWRERSAAQGEGMTHTWLVGRGRKEYVKLAICRGELMPIDIRPRWVRGTVEERYRCHSCGAMLGLVNETVDWSMS